jgi:tRNA(Ile)-lysidine synthase
MERLGPFSTDRRVAVAVSGGPDSLALAWLAARWGRPLALVVDHGLRAEAAGEAALTVARLAGFGVKARMLRLALPPGSTAARAREARHAALAGTCRAEGLAHLLLGHQRGDQAETVLLRALHGSGPAGRAGMSAWHASRGVALLRPLLDVPRARLLATLRAVELAWVEDPSNADPRAERTRLRAAIGEPMGQGPRTDALCTAATGWGARRQEAALAVAGWVAEHVTLHPGLCALLPEGPWPEAALAALIRLVTGSAYPPQTEAVARLARSPCPATLAGARLLRARGAWWLGREAAAMAASVPACEGAWWDGRFRLRGTVPKGAMFGALGSSSPVRGLPAALSATLPAIWREAAVVCAPQAGILSDAMTILPAVPHPVAEAFTTTNNVGGALDDKRPYVVG